MADRKTDVESLIRKEAAISAGANLAINAAIQAWLLRGKGPHPMTVDSIASPAHTVFGSAVPLAVILGIVVSSITWFAFRRKAAALGLAPAERLARPYFFFGLRQALGAALALFGGVVAAGVLWQRFFGTVEISTAAAALFAGLVAAAASWVAATRTSWALLRAD